MVFSYPDTRRPAHDAPDITSAALNTGSFCLSELPECVFRPIPDGELVYWPSVFTPAESRHLMETLLNSAKWTESNIRLYGKTIKMPRQTAWYADPGISYAYSGQTPEHNPWLPELLQIKTRVETICKHAFNGALLNYYRDGRDSMSWHSDNETSLGLNPLIASLSFGATRVFRMRHRDRAIPPLGLPLTDGSLLLMRGATQHYWQHALPKTRKLVGARINITFRMILNPARAEL